MSRWLKRAVVLALLTAVFCTMGGCVYGPGYYQRPGVTYDDGYGGYDTSSGEYYDGGPGYYAPAYGYYGGYYGYPYYGGFWPGLSIGFWGGGYYHGGHYWHGGGHNGGWHGGGHDGGWHGGGHTGGSSGGGHPHH